MRNKVVLPGQGSVLNLKHFIHLCTQTSPLAKGILKPLGTHDHFLVKKAIQSSSKRLQRVAFT